MTSRKCLKSCKYIFLFFFSDIMSETLLIISDKELKRMYEFSKKYTGHYYVIQFIPTGIGTKIIIEDTYNHNQEDVSDYDAW